MKILFVTMQYGRGYSQGTERYLTILSEGIAPHGVRSVFLAADPERRGAGVAGGRFSESPEIHDCATSGWMTVLGRSVESLTALLREQRPDVLHLANPGWVGVNSIAAAKSLGIPVVLTMMDYWWLCPKHTLHHPVRGQCDGRVTWRTCAACVAMGRAGEARAAVARLPVLGEGLAAAATVAAWRRKGVPETEIDAWKRRAEVLHPAMNEASAVIFASRTARELIGARLSGPTAYTIPYGLEPRWFEHSRAKAAERMEPQPAPRRPEELTLGFAGALAPHKGPHVLLEALRRLGWHGTRLRIAGGGDDDRYLARLRSLATALNVDWVGRVASGDMPAFYQSLDALVVPSLWPENLPIVVLEASAVGTPTLASRVGGIAEAIDDAARLFAVDSAIALAECLDRWRQSPTRGGLALPSTAEHMCNETLGVYRRILLREPSI